MDNLNVNELLEKAYDKTFNACLSKRYNEMTMKESELKFRIYPGNQKIGETFKWELEFDKSIDFGYGNWKKFYFKSDRELGKFLFDCGTNNGLPKGAKCILDYNC